MTQLPLFAPAPVVAPAEPSLWARMGAWFANGAPEPRELADARNARIIAETHRAEVRATWGNRNRRTDDDG